MIITRKNHMTTDIGSKAGNLFLLQRAGFQVPPFFCVGQSFREEEVLDYLGANFPDTRSFSVRSCASLEDSDGCSFAGQFKTFLRVPREEVCMRIREVLGHGKHPEKTAYFQAHGIAYEWHYVDIDEKTWHKNLDERNRKIKAGNGGSDFYVDEGLMRKLLARFEAPVREEIDVWYKAGY